MTEPVTITLLTRPDCAFCEHAKQILARIAHDHHIWVTEIDLTSTEGKPLAAQAGILFAPGVLIDGQPFSFGRLSERKLRRVLANRPGSARTTCNRPK